jgi:hypothetical protein
MRIKLYYIGANNSTVTFEYASIKILRYENIKEELIA